ncbi:MAG: hypothetical protein HOV79_00985 [Hamadaea sp.]|nr:hypothetical protein [Hamadaea sp.]
MAGRQLHDIVRDVVAKNAPDETATFEDLYRDALADPHRASAQSSPGASAAGIELAVFLTPILVSVLSDLTKDLLGTGLRAAARRLWGRISGRAAVPPDLSVEALNVEQLSLVSAALARKLRHRGYGQAEIDQICRDLAAATAIG